MKLEIKDIAKELAKNGNWTFEIESQDGEKILKELKIQLKQLPKPGEKFSIVVDSAQSDELAKVYEYFSYDVRLKNPAVGTCRMYTGDDAALEIKSFIAPIQITIGNIEDDNNCDIIFTSECLAVL